MSLEKLKELKIFEIKEAGIISVFENAFSEIEKFANFEMEFFSDYITNFIMISFSWKENFLKNDKRKSKDKDIEKFLISLKIPIDKNEFDDVEKFFDELSKIVVNITDDKKFYDFVFSSSLQKYTVFNCRLNKKFVFIEKLNHKNKEIYKPSEIEFFNKCAILEGGAFWGSFCKFDFSDLKIPSNFIELSLRIFLNSDISTLKKIEIGENVKKIDNLAFEDCKKLKTVILSDKIEYIGKTAFENCNIDNLSHSKITIENGLVFDKEKTELFCITNHQKELYLPLTVKKVNDICYSNLKKISLSENCECYGEILPENCEVELRNEKEEIVANFISSQDINYKYVKKWQRKNPKKSVLEMELLKYNWASCIESFAFRNCKDLTQIKIPNRIESIKRMAFENCLNLSKVEIENPDCDVAELAFHNTNISNFEFENPLLRYYGIKKIKIENGFFFSEDKKTLIDVVIPQKALVIPEGVEEIGFKACCSNKILESVEFPSTLKIINECSFYDCSKLNNVKIPNNCEISSYAFDSCKKLSNIEIPDDVFLRVYNYNFLNNTSVVNLKHKLFTIEDGLIYSKDKKAVLGFTKIPKNLILKEGIISIENFAFSESDNIKSVIFPYSLKEIGIAFENCKNLSKIELKNYETKISKSAFNNCAIDEFNSEKIGQNAFVIKNGIAIIKDKKEIVTFSITNRKLIRKNHSNTLKIPEGVTKIKIETFDGTFCRLLHIPLSVSEIEYIENFVDISIEEIVVEYEGSESDWKKIKYNRDVPKFKKINFFSK